MSELKVRPYTMLPSGQCYDKSEADAVIAELKDDVEYWKKVAKKNMDDNVTMAKQRSEAFKSERHHKYKRCLAMAKACHEKSERMYCEASTAKAINEIIGKEPKDAVVEKFKVCGSIASTHRKIWLALAEEPTWAKFLQLIHKEAK